MLKNLRRNQIENIIKLAEAIETKHPRQRRQYGGPSLDRPADPPDLKELEAALEAIAQPARMEMLALVWVDRGDYRPDAFEEALAYAHENYQSADGALPRRQMGFFGNISPLWLEGDAR